MDFEQLRKAMVETQLIPRGIADPRVLKTFKKVPRHEFIPEKIQSSAYEDRALPIAENQTVSQPYMAAVMTENLQLKGNETVLEVGTGSGYQAAILAELCKKVYSIERFESLSLHARATAKNLGYTNIEFIIGDGTEGYSQAAPYDRILVTAGCPGIPKPLIEQLKDGGRLVIPVGDVFQQILTIVTKEGDKTSIEESVPCVFVPLVGRFGWKSS
ncbi:MAG: protein-L-isoaspartate(D-aspartate) O-methyltransferase [Candidatus Margulisiibacteriota bacterium]